MLVVAQLRTLWGAYWSWGPWLVRQVYSSFIIQVPCALWQFFYLQHDIEVTTANRLWHRLRQNSCDRWRSAWALKEECAWCNDGNRQTARCGPASDFEKMIREDVSILRSTKALAGIVVRGFAMDTPTGRLTELEIDEGLEKKKLWSDEYSMIDLVQQVLRRQLFHAARVCYTIQLEILFQAEFPDEHTDFVGFRAWVELTKILADK